MKSFQLKFIAKPTNANSEKVQKKSNKKKLYCLWRTSSNFYHEKNKIRNKFLSTEYPMRFVKSVINDPDITGHDPIIPKYLCNDFESKPIVLINVPFCNKNGKISNQLLKTLNVFSQ